ncbi:hypothetical protein DM02DRAFT_613279 [Periconia macrospinosa]|uniref:Uncharacterized protein n=1 Tax=Periconia macrospinosa TaxID=97972 RepID=A0A2V1DVI4_9PLEO|nr:hypothetical protein DM02DRAFT_613279 [Periconia macrospinosa]
MPSSTSPPPLSPGQTHALFDILIHHQLYAEIEAFKYSTAIERYGYPFAKADGQQTTSPLLQSLLNKFVLRLPGVSNLDTASFWQDKVSVLVAKLAEAELSESYDKGAIGSRKALATAISSLLEYVARGMLGGYPVKQVEEKDKEGGTGEEKSGKKEYDRNKPEDILQAWDDGMRQLIYGDLLDELFDKAAASDKLSDHSSLVQAAHEYILLNLASFLHHIFIMSPDGQYLLRLLENIHRLIPYGMIRQTLRYGNAATMINAMVRLVLTKLSVTAITNFIGLTNNSNDGMNLLQQIISTVAAWDTAEFQKKAGKLESCREAPKKEVFKAIKAHVYASRDKHDAVRSISLAENKSIIAVILENASPPISTTSLSEDQHAIAMEFYSNYLSIRDREEITKILCKLQPDVLTVAMKDLVSAFEPVIRQCHKAVDLSDTVSDAQNFLNDLIKVSKPKKLSTVGSRAGSRETSRDPSPKENDFTTPASALDASSNSNIRVPTVEDYVNLLRTHMPSAHKFLHQVCSNAPDLANEYRTYARAILDELRVTDSAALAQPTEHGAGSMSLPLQSLFSTLPSPKQDELRPLLDQHEQRLQSLKQTSHQRLNAVIASTHPSPPPPLSPNKPNPNNSANASPSQGNTHHGPGMYLSRWHSLIDSTYITPATLAGPVRRGWQVKGEFDTVKGGKTSSLPSRGAGAAQRKSVERMGVGAVAGVGVGTGAEVERETDSDDGNGDNDGDGGGVLEEDRVRAVWEGLESGWTGVCRGLEVMGPL